MKYKYIFRSVLCICITLIVISAMLLTFAKMSRSVTQESIIQSISELADKKVFISIEVE